MTAPSEIGLRLGSTTIVCINGEWIWFGDWTHHQLETIEHNALRLREIYEEFGEHLESCFGVGKDADDDYCYLFTSDLEEFNKLPRETWWVTLDIDHPWVKAGWIRVSHRGTPSKILTEDGAWRGPNYGAGYFKWSERPPVEPETLPKEYTNFNSEDETGWPYALPDDPYLIMPPPPPPPPPNEFEGRMIFDEEETKKSQSKLF